MIKRLFAMEERIRLTRRYLVVSFLICAFLCGAERGYASSIVIVDPAAAWTGFMNVFELPSNGGAYVFGGTWATKDLVATFSSTEPTLAPNSIDDPSSFWYTPSGGPEAMGNKIMDANMYVETTGT